MTLGIDMTTIRNRVNDMIDESYNAGYHKGLQHGLEKDEEAEHNRLLSVAAIIRREKMRDTFLDMMRDVLRVACASEGVT